MNGKHELHSMAFRDKGYDFEIFVDKDEARKHTCGMYVICIQETCTKYPCAIRGSNGVTFCVV